MSGRSPGELEAGVGPVAAGAVGPGAALGDLAVRIEREERLPGAVPLYVHPSWAARYPWLVQGTTGRGGEVLEAVGGAAAAGSFDLRLFGSLPVGVMLERWRHLREATGCSRAVHARQVHGARVLVHEEGGPPGLFIADGYDGHVTRTPGVLLTVSVADCVPIFLVDPDRRAVALLHGGWRGIAAGVLEEGVAALRELAGSPADALELHLGPAICGDCYEVGPEVFQALGLEPPPRPAPVDLRAVLVHRALQLGIAAGRITVSAFCTRCGGSPFFSHRAGCGERQVGVLGIRPNAA